MEEETSQLPPGQRKPGITGHHLVISSLWQELIVKSNWTVEQLWQVLSFGPSKMLNSKEEKLELGSRRWLIFDPNKKWTQDKKNNFSPMAANQPFQGSQMTGKVISCGLIS